MGAKLRHHLPPPPLPPRDGIYLVPFYKDVDRQPWTNSRLSSLQSSTSVLPQQKTIKDELWYFDINRDLADDVLNADGDYLVRPSVSGGSRSPYVLCVFCGDRVYHLQIRLKKDTRYALGTPYKDEKTFSTVQELVQYYHENEIILLDKGQEREILLKECPLRLYDRTCHALSPSTSERRRDRDTKANKTR